MSFVMSIITSFVMHKRVFCSLINYAMKAIYTVSISIMSHERETAPDAHLNEIADFVFSKPPGEPKSIMLELTAESSDQFGNDEQDQAVLEIFTEIAVLGCKKLWGEEISFMNMSKDNFDLLQKYMNSMGVKLIIRCNDDSADPWELAEKEGIEAVKYLRIAIEFI